MSEGPIVVTETIGSSAGLTIKSPKMDGFFATKYKEKLLEDEIPDTVDHMMANAYSAIGLFRDPKCREANTKQKPMKLLCLGKVQSGKTSFFLGAAALAFDNGYDLVYLLGGTKLRLKKQNFGRVTDAFENNPKVKVLDLTPTFKEDVRGLIQQGFKVIVVVLKNVAKFSNLGAFQKMSEDYEDIPAVIIDDEGDEYTPGISEEMKRKHKKGGATHDEIAKIITGFDLCTFLSVTATPQANLLISTYDAVSPDRLVLVQPGEGYEGGSEFFDSIYNQHVIRIEDTDDFKTSIPDSFEEALGFFLFSCALKLSQGDTRPYSMLVHPSSFNAIQQIVASRIKNHFETVIKPGTEESGGIARSSLVEELEKARDSYLSMNKDADPKVDFNKVLSCIKEVVDRSEIQIINYQNSDDEDDDEKKEESDPLRYKIKVGGNMLGRGLTIKRLIVSYIYRDSKTPAVDTMYQRCRWFGYKSKYFDVCRVYMTSDLRNKFIAIVKNEDHMWNAVEAFLDTQIDAKKFKRIFYLEDDRLILTRKTVSRTITMKAIGTGNTADVSVDLTPEEKAENRSVYLDYKAKHLADGAFIDFDTSATHYQRHLVIHTKFTIFYQEFLSKLHYAFGSPFSANLFQLVLDSIKRGERPDDLTVILTRPATGESRQPTDSTETTIAGLLQGRNDGTNFKGDAKPVDMNGHPYEKEAFVEVHFVKFSDDAPLSTAFPLVSFNNPLTASVIKMVTGDNNYD
jgi:hypothetical protein